MWVAVADHLKVDVVGVPAAGEHGVQLLPGLLPGQQAVHGVGRDPLRGMNGGGVTESGWGRDVIRGELALELAAAVSDGEATAAVDVGDGPAGAAFHPFGGRDSDPPVVRPGDDHVADTGPVSVPRRTSCSAGPPWRR